ncbi:MAG: hypothetical protein LC778_07505 [Acidobacteria bacterium]|nr:hypothetical protein [Acidobacteriota bacterium]
MGTIHEITRTDTNKKSTTPNCGMENGVLTSSAADAPIGAAVAPIR